MSACLAITRRRPTENRVDVYVSIQNSLADLEPPMLCRSRFSSAALSLLVFLVLPGVALAGDRAARCEATVDRAADAYSACLVRGDAHSIGG